jgi:hypothetical protein
MLSCFEVEIKLLVLNLPPPTLKKKEKEKEKSFAVTCIYTTIIEFDTSQQ